MVALPPQLGCRLGDRQADRGLPLDLGLEDLAGRARRELVVVVGLEDRVCPLGEGKRLGIEKHVLLLEAERVWLRRTEVVFCDVRAAGCSHAASPFAERIAVPVPCGIGEATAGPFGFLLKRRSGSPGQRTRTGSTPRGVTTHRGAARRLAAAPDDAPAPRALLQARRTLHPWHRRRVPASLDRQPAIRTPFVLLLAMTLQWGNFADSEGLTIPVCGGQTKRSRAVAGLSRGKPGSLQSTDRVRRGRLSSRAS